MKLPQIDFIFISKVLLIPILIGFCISFAFYFQYVGFDQGSFIEQKIYEEIQRPTVDFSHDGVRKYQFFADKYLVIIFLFGSLIIFNLLYLSKLVSNRIALHILNLAVALITFFYTWTLISRKTEVLNNFSSEFDILLCNTISYDWIVLSAVFLYLVIKIITLVLFFSNKNKRLSTKEKCKH